ncbi:MAG: zinc ribbon domain-containing protein [Phycisphaerae bacterium]|nr:zinc ribbon domain-containing protein [Phycisphaerae bacterium]
MPTYEYQACEERASCPRCRERFEVTQFMGDCPLTACPSCGSPVQRVVSLCQVSTKQSTRSTLSDRNLRAKGFTKLVNEGDGKFRRTT